MGHIPVRPSAIIIKGHEVLILYCRYGDKEFYLFPGGGVEKGEQLADCAKRETLEETGIEVEIGRIAYVNDWIENPKTDARVLNLFFLAHPTGGKLDPSVKDGGKVLRVEWMPLERIEGIDLRPRSIARRIAQDARNGFPTTAYLTD